ncbi:MAG: hypothetical protein ABSA04_09075 [Desulfobaccales bacterium]
MNRGRAGAEVKTLKEKLTKPEFRRWADEMLVRLTLEAPFWPENEEKQQQRLRQAAADPFYFCRTYLPHHFSQVSAPFHYELAKLLEPPSDTGDPAGTGDPPAGPDGTAAGTGTPKPESLAAVVAAPREFGKTTSAFGYVLQQICFRRRRFIIIGSDTEDRASDLTGHLYLELLYNQRLHQDFGELAKAGRPVDDFITANGIRVKARGRGQRLRGLKFSLRQPYRPDLVILDDLETDTYGKYKKYEKYEKYGKNKKEAADPEIVRQILDWVKLEVFPSLEAGGNLLILGTILRWRSALHLMITGDEEPFRHFRRRIYRAVQEDGSSLWEARYPAERLKLQKRFLGMAAFNREKMNEPLPEAGLFREEWIHYYHPDILKDRQLLVAGFFEPSLEIGAGAGYRAVVTVGWDRRQLIFYVMEAFIRRGTLEEALRSICHRHRRCPYEILGVANSLFQGLLFQEFERLGREEGGRPPLQGVSPRLAAESRVAALSPMLARGRIRFIRGHSDQDLLVEQLLYFPSRALGDHGPEALAGAVSLAQESR